MERASDRRAGWSLLLLALGLVCEGFDLQIANFAAGDMMRTLHLGKAEFAPFLSASLFGMLIGAPTIGRLGDRAGRRVVIAGGNPGLWRADAGHDAVRVAVAAGRAALPHRRRAGRG